MKLHELIANEEYISSEADPELSVNSIATDTDDIKEDCLFIVENAEKMPDFSALEIKPRALVITENSNVSADIPKITVKNARASSALIHSRFWQIDYDKLKIIGITGTNGKTTTATMIYTVLKNKGIKTGFIGTGKIEIMGNKVNETYYSMTTPPPNKLYKVIRKMQDCGCTHIVMEVSSHALSQERVFPIIFEYAVFTNLSEEHMDYHNGMEDYYQTKLKLFNKAKKSILNIDDPYVRRAASEIKGKKLTVGVLFRGDAYATEIEDRGFDGFSYYYHTEKFCYKADLLLAGIHNIYNSMLAACLCIDAGISPREVKESLSKIASIPGRFEIIKDEITVIIDYAHTPKAFENILKCISSEKRNAKLTVVFGCGGNRDKSKRPKMASIAERFADRIIVTSDNPRNEDPLSIIKDITDGFGNAPFEICVDRRAAVEMAISESKEGDIVAVIGKGNEEYTVDKNGYHTFSEKEIVHSALSKYKNEN